MLVIGGCSINRAAEDGWVGEQQLRADSMLLSALRSTPIPWDAVNNAPTIETVNWATHRSSIVDGLQYRTAIFTPRPSTHVRLQRVVAMSSNDVRLVDDLEGWSAVVPRVPPRSRSEALSYCLEAYSFAGPKRHFEEPAVYRDSTWFDIAIPPPVEARSRVHPPRVEIDEATAQWRAILWIMEVGRGTRYECTIRSDPDLSLRLEAVDSILGMGYLAVP